MPQRKGGAPSVVIGIAIRSLARQKLLGRKDRWQDAKPPDASRQGQGSIQGLVDVIYCLVTKNLRVSRC